MENKSIIVVAGATHREGFLDEYESQLASADIPFHLEPLPTLASGANSITMRRRIDYMRAMCEKFIDYKRIVMTDAWDVLLMAPKEELINKVPIDGMVVSGERNCYPEPHLHSKFYSSSAWRFVNNGCLAGNPEYILEWIEKASETDDLEILDQAWFNRRRAESWTPLWIDETTELFYVVSATQEDGALQMKRYRPCNTRYDTTPCFFHFSGRCPDDRFRAMLKGEVESL